MPGLKEGVGCSSVLAAGYPCQLGGHGSQEAKQLGSHGSGASVVGQQSSASGHDAGVAVVVGQLWWLGICGCQVAMATQLHYTAFCGHGLATRSSDRHAIVRR